ncbi:MAG: glycosyltransferase [Ruminococcaceae bacterium]|nr:glycosyltransferase [Oscillospiraceae bacterium]
MGTIVIFNFIISVIFFLCYAYQFFYIPVSLFGKEPPHKPEKKHRFAVLVSARNEEKVIGELIKSINSQTYGKENVRVFVVADNCTDETAKTARSLGAKVYKRFNLEKIGKGYALEELLSHISEDYPKNYFDGFFVFDADNVLEENYIEEMNKTFSDGFNIITGYRNSKNYGDNWISAGYSLWFLRESRYLNNSRFLLGNSCAVSGTGFFFSRVILEKCGGWPFHLLTEDIEFTVHNITRGEKIGFCKNAVLYDEQPVSFRQSWRQRIRWAKGYLQVFGKYGKELFKGIFRGDFSCFDMTMNIMPAVVLSISCAAINLASSIQAVFSGESLLPIIASAGEWLFNMYLTLFAIGAVTTVSEWKQIHTSKIKKIFYAFTFPLFMFTYIPISVAAIFKKVEWKPIEHKIKTSVSELKRSA